MPAPRTPIGHTALPRLRAVRQALPTGHTLPADAWASRHVWMVRLVVAHAVIVAAWGLAASPGSPLHALGETAPLVVAAAAARSTSLPRRWRAVAAILGLYGGSVMFVHLSGGVIEMHFHVFLVVILASFYEDWLPVWWTGLAVLLHHGVMGRIDPGTIYNHPDALDRPWRWAAVHLAFVAVAGAIGVVRWRATELERRRADRVLDATNEGIYGLDLDGSITFANGAAGRLLGWEPVDLVGRHHHAVLRHALEDSEPFTPDECVTCAVVAAGTGDVVRHHVVSRSNGTSFPVELRAEPIEEAGERVGTVVSFRDVTRQVELAHRATHDALTGLPNRDLLRERLELALAGRRRADDVVGVLFIDLDGFKAVNDRLGHEVGDRVLIEAARRIRRVVRPGDTVARYGGDEFVVVCDALLRAGDAMVVARRVLEAFQEPFHVDGLDLVLSPSIGVATDRPGASAGGLVQRADDAMYRAKELGRARVEVAAPVDDHVTLDLDALRSR